MANFDPEYVVALSGGLSVVHAEAVTLFERGGATPCPGSIAEREHQTFVRPQSIMTACTVSTLLLEYGAEHLSAFQKTIAEPMEPFAAYTAVRSMLEACSVIVWISDPKVGAQERVARVFAHRHAGQTQMLKCARSFGAAAAEIATIEGRIAAIESDALAAGYSPIVDKNGTRISGAGTRMPGATELIKSALDEEPLYRALSAVAHGHTWALSQLGFEMTPGTESIGPTTVHKMTKTVKVEVVATVGTSGVRAFAKALWIFGQYVGWDRTSLTAALEKMFDALYLKDSKRFWR